MGLIGSSVDDRDCTVFLQWALPHHDFRWPGFRKVRRQVCKRLERRIRELGLDDLAAYRRRLEADPAEWRAFDQCCHITISRFFRDRRVPSHADGTAPSINGRLPVPAPLPSQRLVLPDAWLANAHKAAEMF